MALTPAISPRITPAMLALIAEVDEFKGAWRAVGRLTPERLLRLRTIATIESVGSSTRIEGARLSDREVERLLGRAQASSLSTRDEQEVAGYAAVMDVVLANYGAIPVTENFIKQLHSMLLQYSTKDTRHRGQYKKLSNRIEAFDSTGTSLGVLFETSSPFHTPGNMSELVAWYAAATGSASIHPLMAAGIFIVVFLAIHPFQDGNGRLSRILTTLLLLRAGYAHVPYASLESIIEERKDAYYLALRRTQVSLTTKKKDWTPWLTFFLDVLRQHKRRIESKLERESAMHAAITPLAAAILDLVTQHGPVSVRDLVRLTAAPRGTVKKRLLELVAAGHLDRNGNGRATVYARA